MIEILTNTLRFGITVQASGSPISQTSGSSVTAISRVLIIVLILIGITLLVSIWKVFKKAGKPGWAAIIPFYATWTLFEVGGFPGYLGLGVAVLLSIGSFSRNIVFEWITFLIYFILYVLVALNIAKRFNKTMFFAVFGLIVFPYIGFPMLAWSDAKYEGGASSTKPSLPSSQNTTPPPPTPENQSEDKPK